MEESRSVKFLGLLRALLRHGVDFFVVGGVAAQLEGSPILDPVHRLITLEHHRIAPGHHLRVPGISDNAPGQRRFLPEHRSKIPGR